MEQLPEVTQEKVEEKILSPGEQELKLKREMMKAQFLAKHQKAAEAWVRTHGNHNFPTAMDSKGNLVWLNRAQRRKLKK